ncbi:MAG: hypothetical protein ISR65_07045 [Bacteriovoracaceae bacterium]|nr:hypothetical protein [Bacteriovoracaceae bacterium]
MRALRIIVIVTFVSAWALPAHGMLRLGGFYKSQLLAMSPIFSDVDRDISKALFNNIGRIKIFYSYSDALSMDFAYSLGLIYQFAPDTTIPESFQDNSFSYRLLDIKTHIFHQNLSTKDILDGLQNLDRLVVNYSHELFELQVGRMPISFGSARVINPTDIFVPDLLTAIDTEERQGVDGIRLKKPWGQMGEIDLGFVFGEKFKSSSSAAFINLRYSLWENDLSAMAMRFNQNMLWGLDIAGSLFRAGYWIEMAYVDAKQSTNYYRLSIGSEYLFFGALTTFIEYHYSSLGGVFLLGKHYLTPGINYQLSPLVTLMASSTINLTDVSALINLKFEWNFSEDCYLDAGTFIAVGEGTPGPADFSNYQVKSEFGHFPTTIYTSMRVYF